MNAEGKLTDLGRYNQTKADADRGAFRTPSVQRRKDRSLYARWQQEDAEGSRRFLRWRWQLELQLDKERRRPLSGQERADLVAFLWKH